ncbi:MAG TPA: acyl-CoA dehydrogenase family protein [Dehalococcoidia bacterium]|nr:acyl-CoA dehydrogenase family protein [Dehalococcoidia bacterium]
MDFRFSPEEEAFRQEVRRFLDEALTDEVRTRFGLLDTPERQRFGDKLAERGWLGLGFPSEYGGAGEGLRFAPYILNQELLRAQAPIVGKNVGIIANVILRHGSEELKKEFLPRIFRNEIQWAIAYTEPEAGSDLANLQCRAVLEGDEFVVTGTKRFITSAHFADYYWAAVRTDPTAQPKHRGISLLIIDASLPGITVTPMWTIIGERTNEVYFDNVRVPKKYLVGELNQGWYYVMEALNFERFTLTSTVPTEQKFRRLVEWVKAAQVDGRRLADDPGVRRLVARLAVLVEMARMLEIRCICTAVNPENVAAVEAAMNKMWGAVVETELADATLDLMGTPGYLAAGDEEAPLGGQVLDDYLFVGHMRVAAAGVDIAKNLIAKRLLGLPSGS